MDVPRARRIRRTPIAAAAALALAVPALSVAVARIAKAPPVVDRSTIWVDTVRRGSLAREVGGPGSLVPEEIRWVTALAEGRVERILAAPGVAVEPDTLLVELVNQDLEVHVGEARRDVEIAEADLAGLRAKLDAERLAQHSLVGRVRTRAREAERRLEAQEKLASHQLVAELDLIRAREEAAELAERLRLEVEHSAVLERAIAAQLRAKEAQLERPRALARLRAEQWESLRVRAGRSGVLQALPVEIGKRIAPGGVLAKVADPTRLKAELRIPEAQAREIRIGLPVRVAIDVAETPGRVVRVDPAVREGTVTVDVALVGPLPPGARPDLSAEGRIELERFDDVLYTGRGAYSEPRGTVSWFRVDDDASAHRVRVRLGAASVSEIEVVEGLREGDRVILSDMSAYDGVDELRLE